MNADADAVLETWFGNDQETPDAVDERARLWFAPDSSFDELIRDQFASFPDRALAGEFSDWAGAARSCLALVLVLDQFPRNLYRGSSQSFAYDATALEVCRDALARGLDGELSPLEAVFLYLPLEHTEDLHVQTQSVSMFRKLLGRASTQLTDRFESFLVYAQRHHAVIEQFGRFPHRNAVLGRRSTSAEIDYMESGGETFSV